MTIWARMIEVEDLQVRYTRGRTKYRTLLTLAFMAKRGFKPNATEAD